MNRSQKSKSGRSKSLGGPAPSLEAKGEPVSPLQPCRQPSTAVKAPDEKSSAADAGQKNVTAKKPGPRRLSYGQRAARAYLDSAKSGAIVATNFIRGGFQNGGKVDLKESARLVEAQVAAVRAGDMSGPEAMLVSQSMALEAIANEMFRRALVNIDAGYVPAGDIFMRHALKAQAQCRANIEALTELKNPRPVAFIKQANMANGPQQVNNGVAASQPSPRAENEISPAKLLEQG